MTIRKSNTVHFELLRFKFAKPFDTYRFKSPRTVIPVCMEVYFFCRNKGFFVETSGWIRTVFHHTYMLIHIKYIQYEYVYIQVEITS